MALGTLERREIVRIWGGGLMALGTLERREIVRIGGGGGGGSSWLWAP